MGKANRFPHRWTRVEYERLAETGVLDPSTRIELVDGEVFDMPPQSTRHYTAIRLVEQALNRVFGDGFDVRTQGPLAIDEHSEPGPDIAVVAGSPRDYRSSHPSTAVLICEVADSSLGFDRVRKKRTYARNGIGEYWILDLNAGCLEVYRSPQADNYLRKQTLAGSDRIAPLAAPTRPLQVSDLLP
jgi:Uma2 family endonuclease